MKILGINIPGTTTGEIEVDSKFDNISQAYKHKSGLEIDSNLGDLGSNYTRQSLYYYQMASKLRKYRDSGFTQNIINSIADDSTREWFKIMPVDMESEDQEKLNELIQKRFKELGFQSKLRDAIKFSRIYSEGSGLYYGVITEGENLEENKKEESININKIENVSYINLLETPDYFTFTFMNQSDPTQSNYREPQFQISGKDIHNSRISWIVNEFDVVSLNGISIVDKIEKGIIAQDSGIKGAGHILQRVGAVIFKSGGVSLGNNTKGAIQKLMTIIKERLKSEGAMGIREDDTLETLKHTFAGIKDVYEFVLDNLSGLANIAREIVIGKQRGGIISLSSGQTDLINYYTSVESYQENTLNEEIRKLTNMLLMEKSNSAILEMTGGKLIDFKIDHNPLWILTEKEQAENRKLSAESDQIDFLMGKSDAGELRSMDPYYSNADKLKTDPRPIGKEPTENNID